VEWADLEALDLSKFDQPGGRRALASQVLTFIDKNGIPLLMTSRSVLSC
jgi:hypothetical protein